MPDAVDPNPRARERLIEIMRNDARGVLADSALLASLLAGWGGYEAENALLIAAYEQRVPQDLIGAPSGSVNRLVDFLTSRLSTVAGMPYANAKWAVESWALALSKELDHIPGAASEASQPSPQVPQPTTEPPPANQAAQAPPSNLAGPRAQTGIDRDSSQAWRNAQQQSNEQAGQQWNGPPGQQPMNQGVLPPAFGSTGSDQNTSATNGPVPFEVNRGKWNWGAFALSWMWLMAHNMIGWGIGMLFASFLCWPVNLASAIYLGISGDQLAWQHRRFQNIEEFVAVEKSWEAWGFALFCLSILGWTVYFVGLIIYPSVFRLPAFK